MAAADEFWNLGKEITNFDRFYGFSSSGGNGGGGADSGWGGGGDFSDFWTSLLSSIPNLTGENYNVAISTGYNKNGVSGVWTNIVDVSPQTRIGESGSSNFDASFSVDVINKFTAINNLASSQRGGGWLDNLQTGLDVAGIADPTGLVDLGNALIYAGRGQWGNAGISALAIIPYIGDVGKVGRLGAKTLQLTSRARTAENGLELAGKFLKPGYAEIAPGVFRSSDQLRQFRMTTSDITGAHGLGPHFNFEIFSPLNLNKAATNYHVPIINP